MRSSITAGLVFGTTVITLITVLAYVLACTADRGAITMAIGGTIVAVPAALLTIYAVVTDRR